MRYWGCTLAGIGIFLACVVGFSAALADLLEVGTCASGNTPYVIARECPDGMGTKVLLLVASILGLFVAMGVFALRGRRPGGGKGPGGSPYVAGWGIFFCATGAVSLVHSLTSETIPADGELGGIIVGATFLLMGLPALVYWIWSVFMDLGGRDERPTGLADRRPAVPRGFGFGTSSESPAPAGAQSSGDTISDLERLQKLRDAGALTPAEFEEQKARILRGT